MLHYLTHRVILSFRKLSAVSLTIIYMLIVLSPLASLAMLSKSVAHAVTGECSGDCNICGCSLESRAKHTCCCSKKKQCQTNIAGLASHACDTQKNVFEQKKDCCPNSESLHGDTVKSATSHDKDVIDNQAQNSNSKNSEAVYKCGCPCSKGKLLTFAGFGSKELLPISLHKKMEPQYVETLFADLSQHLPLWQCEPPDPPPRYTHST